MPKIVPEFFEILPIENTAHVPSGYTTYPIIQHEGEFIMGFREEGSVAGNHYHKGNSYSKNPQVILLSTGKIRLDLENLKTGEKQTFEIQAPKWIKVYPYVWHVITGLTDFSFLEFNSATENGRDTHYDREQFIQ